MFETITIRTGVQPFSPRLKATLDTFFAGIGQGFNAYLTSGARLEEIERHYALSDEELAEMGLEREDIPRHVFRDLF